ncbi:hypothetical protein H0O00_01705 [Candidatus Micrarchaeota archaeon]|nr:hypothetical protein [Candidatus Micrarchaeota archaeon]
MALKNNGNGPEDRKPVERTGHKPQLPEKGLVEGSQKGARQDNSRAAVAERTGNYREYQGYINAGEPLEIGDYSVRLERARDDGITIVTVSYCGETIVDNQPIPRAGSVRHITDAPDRGPDESVKIRRIEEVTTTLEVSARGRTIRITPLSPRPEIAHVEKVAIKVDDI